MTRRDRELVDYLRSGNRYALALLGREKGGLVTALLTRAHPQIKGTEFLIEVEWWAIKLIRNEFQANSSLGPADLEPTIVRACQLVARAIRPFVKGDSPSQESNEKCKRGDTIVPVYEDGGGTYDGQA